MGKERFPSTRAIRVLKESGVNFLLRHYKYEDKGGTSTAARELGLDEHQVVKTLVMEDENGGAFLVLMHGDKKVSTKALARILRVKTVSPCQALAANKHTGYVVGGTSPFGTRKPLDVLMESSIMGLPKIYVNAGKRGLLAEMSPIDLANILRPRLVNAAIGDQT